MIGALIRQLQYYAPGIYHFPYEFCAPYVIGFLKTSISPLSTTLFSPFESAIAEEQGAIGRTPSPAAPGGDAPNAILPISTPLFALGLSLTASVFMAILEAVDGISRLSRASSSSADKIIGVRGLLPGLSFLPVAFLSNHGVRFPSVAPRDKPSLHTRFLFVPARSDSGSS